MKSHVITNGKVTISLADIGKTIKKSIAEMYCLSLGIQVEAEGQGCEWASIVCTLPARMHPNPTVGENTWDGTTPNNAGKEISKKFARVRAILAKSGITLSGVWTREAHLDATPHVNYLVYFPAGMATKVENAFCKHFSQS